MISIVNRNIEIYKRRNIAALLRKVVEFSLRLPKTALLLSVRLYQLTRILRTPSCRFYPSCSQYMAKSVERHGACKGAILTLLRLAKCHPFHPGGIDEVPHAFSVGSGLSSVAKACFSCKRLFQPVNAGIYTNKRQP